LAGGPTSKAHWAQAKREQPGTSQQPQVGEEPPLKKKPGPNWGKWGVKKGQMTLETNSQGENKGTKKMR